MALNSPQELARIAAKLKQRARATGRKRAPFDLAFLTDEKVIDTEASITRLPSSPQITCAVIFRHYQHADRGALAEKYRDLARRGGHLFLVAGDEMMATKLSADGMHLPTHQLTDLPALRATHPALCLSAACHSQEDLTRAAAYGADCAFLSPVFETSSHPDARPLGLEEAKKLAATATLPVLALGGINAQNAGALLDTGFQGIGAIDAFTEDQTRT